MVIQTVTQCFDASHAAEYQSALEQDNHYKETFTTPKTASGLIQMAIRQFITQMHQRLIVSVYLATERTIRALNQRISTQKQYLMNDTASPNQDTPDDLFWCDFELYNNTLRIQPDPYELKDAFKEIVHQILSVPSKIPLWNAEGDFYQSVITQLSPVVLEKSEEQKIDQLKLTLELSQTAKK